MDSTSNKRQKKKHRLSLGRKNKSTAESPTTPTTHPTLLSSPNVVDLTSSESSPVVRARQRDENLCSTPVNNRKRSCPPDDQESSPVITFTQDLRRFGNDVAWQWNSPQSDDQGPPSRQFVKISNIKDSPSPIRSRSHRPTQLSGFHNFAKGIRELGKQKDDSPNVAVEVTTDGKSRDSDVFETAKTSCSQEPLPCTNEGAGPSKERHPHKPRNGSPDVFEVSEESPETLNVSMKSSSLIRVATNLNKSFNDLVNVDLNASVSKKVSANEDSFRKYKSSGNFDLKNEADKFFDDSDFEFDAFLLSELIESKMRKSEDGQPVPNVVTTTVTSVKPVEDVAAIPQITSGNSINLDAPFNDSMDDCLSQLPINEMVANFRQNQQSTNRVTSSPSFGRHNTMPESPQLLKSKSKFQYKHPSTTSTVKTTSMQRHVSMPPSNITGISRYPAIGSQLSSAQGSVESLPSNSSISPPVSTTKCSAEEIERKRQWAIQRRKATLAKLNFMKGKR